MAYFGIRAIKKKGPLTPEEIKNVQNSGFVTKQERSNLNSGK